ncbi:MAG: F0F1 ATP synthase subunit epsilon [Prolixibacteraceae bacterium]|nr:F0F1 ATP synthase subunit epsilon [Prolixibacteraceae bacterium]
MFVEIITPEKTLFSGDVRLIQVPGSKTPFVMLEHHAPIISLLDKGFIKIIRKDDKEEYFEIAGGFVENKKNKIVALVELPEQAQ